MRRGRKMKDFMALCESRFGIRTVKDLARMLGVSEKVVRMESQGKVPEWWYRKLGLASPETGESPDLFALETIELKYGETAANMVMGYPDEPLVSMEDISASVGVSREGVRQWLTKVHGTSKRGRISAGQVAKGSTMARMRKALVDVPELIEMGVEPVSTTAGYVRTPAGTTVLVRNLKWSKNESGYQFASIRFSEKFAPDMIIAVMEGVPYVFRSPGFSDSGTSIPRRKLEPFRNRFDYLAKPLSSVPRIRFGQKAKSGFMGVVRVKDGWSAKVVKGGVHVSLGSFSTPEDAAVAHDRAVLSLRPARKCLNGLGFRPYTREEVEEIVRGNNPPETAEAVFG